jgi:hypothetical protein
VWPSSSHSAAADSLQSGVVVSETRTPHARCYSLVKMTVWWRL